MRALVDIFLGSIKSFLLDRLLFFLDTRHCEA